jgi:hypothetical protein
MMKKIMLAVIFVVSLSVCTIPANAALVNPSLVGPDILSYGTYEYASGTGDLSFTAVPIAVIDGGGFDIIQGGNYSANLVVDNAGNFVSGNLAITGTVNGNPLSLTGEITEFGFYDVPGPIAIFDFKFNVNGNGVGGNVAFAEFSTFDGNWDVNHVGERVKIDTAAIPIPSTIVLFGFGLVGLVAIRRRFRS